MSKSELGKLLSTLSLPLTPTIIYDRVNNSVFYAFDAEIYEITDPYEGGIELYHQFQTVVRRVDFVPHSIFATISTSEDGSRFVSDQGYPLVVSPVSVPSWTGAMMEVTFNLGK
jgi:hypothetical protein